MLLQIIFWKNTSEKLLLRKALPIPRKRRKRCHGNGENFHKIDQKLNQKKPQQIMPGKNLTF